MAVNFWRAAEAGALFSAYLHLSGLSAPRVMRALCSRFG
jgi:hypothetical protein